MVIKTKKVLCLILLISLLVSVIPFSAFANTEISSDLSEEGLKFLNAIGIIEQDDSLNFKSAEDKVTVLEFSALASRAVNKNFVTDKNYYPNISEGTFGYDEINYLTEMNVISILGDFEPTDNIGFYDALAIMLKLMGYNDFSYKNSSAYSIEVCRKYGIFTTNELTKSKSNWGDILNMYYRLLDTKIMTLKSLVSDNEYSYKVTDETILSKYHDIYSVTGILQDDGYININDFSEYSLKTVCIDGFVINRNDVFLGDMVGEKVKAYYYDKWSPTLIGAYSRDNNTVKLDSNSITKFEKFSYYYTDGKNNEKRIRINNDITVLYNNRLLKKYDSSLMAPEHGTVTLIDNDADGEYEIVKVKSYVSMVVKTEMQAEEPVTIPVNVGLIDNVLIEDLDRCIIKNDDGSMSDIESISEGDVLSLCVIEEDSKYYANEIIITKTRVTGNVTEVFEDGGDYIIVLNNEEYKENFVSGNVTSEIKPSSEIGVFYLNFLNEIVYCDYETSNNNFACGYLLEYELTNRNFNNCIRFKIFDEIGRLKIYESSSKITVDGTLYKKRLSDVKSLLDSKNCLNELILFKINNDGEIICIDLPADYSHGLQTEIGDRLVKMGNDDGINSNRGLYYNKENKSLGGRIILNANTKIFLVPEDVTDAEEKDFDILTLDGIISGRYYNAQSYSMNSLSPYADFLIVKNNQKYIANNTTMAVVCDIGKTTNESGDEVSRLTLYSSDGYYTYPVKYEKLVTGAMAQVESVNKTGYTVQAGDIVRYSTDANNEINQLLICYDYSEDQILTNTKASSSAFSSNPRIFAVTPYDIKDTYMLAVDSSVTDFASITANDIEYLNLSLFSKKLSVKKGRNGFTVEESGTGDIKTFADYGIKHSRAIIQTRNGLEVMMIIYNEQ